MRNDRKIDISCSASAEDYIRRFMEAAERTKPNASLVPIFHVAHLREIHEQSNGRGEDVWARRWFWRD